MSLAGRELTDEEKLEIRAAIRVIDPIRMAIVRQMTPAQRAQEAFRLIEQAESRKVSELCAKYPQLDPLDALIIVRGGPERYVACQLAKHQMGEAGDHLASAVKILRLFAGKVDSAELETCARHMGCLDLWREWQPAINRDSRLHS